MHGLGGGTQAAQTLRHVPVGLGLSPRLVRLQCPNSQASFSFKVVPSLHITQRGQPSLVLVSPLPVGFHLPLHLALPMGLLGTRLMLGASTPTVSGTLRLVIHLSSYCHCLGLLAAP